MSSVDARTLDLERARRFVQDVAPEVGLVHVAVTGAHAYGFASRDSDVDLKGIHLAPADELLGLGEVRTVREALTVFEGLEHDLTLHEAASALELLLRGNGNVLERLMSPLQLVPASADADFAALRALVPGALSGRFFVHYRGYLRTLMREHEARPEPTAKRLLYIYRVALTGAHLLMTGECLLDLPSLAERYPFDELDALIALKREGLEKGTVPTHLDTYHRSRWPDLVAHLDGARRMSALPELPSGREALSRWLVSTRLARFAAQ